MVDVDVQSIPDIVSAIHEVLVEYRRGGVGIELLTIGLVRVIWLRREWRKCWAVIITIGAK